MGLAARFQLLSSIANKFVLSRSLNENGKTSTPSRWLLRFENFLMGLSYETCSALKEMKKRGQKVCNSVDELFLDNKKHSKIIEPLLKPAPRPAPRPPSMVLPKKVFANEVETLIRNPYAIYTNMYYDLKIKEKNTEASSWVRARLLKETLQEFLMETSEKWPKFEIALQL